MKTEKRPSLIGSFFKMIISGFVLLAVAVLALVLTIPDVTQLERCFTTSMFQVELCPNSPNYVKLEDISSYMIHALIVAEDGSFYQHKGFDWHEIQESFEANLRAGTARRGGSTLTQQLAKNAFLSAEKSLWRKAKEAYLAYAIESRYKKDFILEKYLNVVEFGPNLYGIKAAARHYFQKSPADLHPLDAAYLAHLLPNPKVYSQGFRRGALTPFSKRMISTILKRMNAYGKLSEPTYERALALMDEFPWRTVSMSTFSDAPSWSLDMDVPMPNTADLEYDDTTVEHSIDATAEDPTPQELEREVNSALGGDFE